MDSFKQAIFLKELFKLKREQSDNKEFSLASQFGDDFLKGLSDDNPYINKDQLQKIQSSKTEEEIIDLLKNSNIDIVGAIDDIFNHLSKTDISHGGHQIDGSVIKDYWDEVKNKYKSHSESEDINNI